MPTYDANTLAQIDPLINKTRVSIAALDDTIRQIKDLSGGYDRALHLFFVCTARDLLDYYATSLESNVERPVQQPLNTLETRTEILADHRRAHRRGIPPKIDSDPELRAFIIARIATMKFTEIEAEVRANFPPDRHTSKSALSRWWIREGQFIAVNRQL